MALLVSFGTDGDVLPFVGLGTRLRARGHRVTLAANEHFRAGALERGLEFRPLVSEAETQSLLGNPNVWHPFKSALLGARWARRGLFRQYQVIAEAAQQPGTVIVGYPPVFAASVAREKLRCPLVTLVTLPWLLLSDAAPPALPGAARCRLLRSPWAARTGWRLGEVLTDLLLGRELNRLRCSLGLRPVRNLYRWCFSPDMNIGLFPDWYAPPQSDWPRPMRVAGFSMFDGAKTKDLPGELLEFCQAGERPVVFTFGTGMLHGKELFRASLECCEALKVRGIFVTKFSAQLPAPLPKTARLERYAPFSQLFPKCAAVVHHGGAGTTAQALAAGVPQLILPLAWDQPDNAFRVKHLGAGDWLDPRSSGRVMARALAGLMTSKRRDQSKQIAHRFQGADPLERGADWVEQTAAANASQKSCN